jgi:hypothetical protein
MRENKTKKNVDFQENLTLPETKENRRGKKKKKNQLKPCGILRQKEGKTT